MEFVKAAFLPTWRAWSGALSAALIQVGTAGGRLVLGFWAIAIACISAILASAALQFGVVGIVAVAIGLAFPFFGARLLEEFLLALRGKNPAQQAPACVEDIAFDLSVGAMHQGATDFIRPGLTGNSGFDCGGLDLF